jgi:site-specific DNA recombinase
VPETTVATPRLRALIYNRVSSDPAGRRISTDSQDVENRAVCAQHGWEVAASITDDDRSASRFASRRREGYDTVLQALDGHGFGRIDVLVTWESSRGERRLDGYVALRDRLERNRVLLAYKGRIFDMAEGDDRFLTGLDALLDEREAERARERTMRSHRDSVQRGTPRGVIPYGYQREYDPHTGHMVAQTPDPETAPVVREIVARILGGDTLYSLAQDLNRRGVLTPRGHQDRRTGREVERAGWSSSMIRNLLRKQSLIGIRTHHGQAQGQATWEPIVSPDDWLQVQGILADPHRAARNGGVQVRYLMSGIAECGVCGAWLRPLTNRGRPTYVCAGKVPSAGKGHVSRTRGPLDATVTVYVVKRLQDPALLEQIARRHEGDEQRASGLVREIADLEAELAQYVKSAGARTGIARAAFAQVVDDLSAQIEGKQAELAGSSRLPQVVLDVAGPDAATRWGALTLERQRQVIRALVRVVVHRSNQRRGVRGFDESSVEIIDL